MLFIKGMKSHAMKCNAMIAALRSAPPIVKLSGFPSVDKFPYGAYVKMT
jgi:hypothetical protein